MFFSQAAEPQRVLPGELGADPDVTPGKRCVGQRFVNHRKEAGNHAERNHRGETGEDEDGSHGERRIKCQCLHPCCRHDDQSRRAGIGSARHAFASLVFANAGLGPLCWRKFLVRPSKRLQTAGANRAVPVGRIKISRLQTKIHGAGVKTAGLRLRQLPVRPIENNINVAQMPRGNRRSVVVRFDLDSPGRRLRRWTRKRRRQ